MKLISMTPSPARRALLLDALEARQHLSRSQIVGYLQGGRMGAMDLNKVDWSALTQINYFTMIPTSAGAMPTTANDSANLTRLDQVVAAAHAHGVKVVVTIGGAGQDGTLLSIIGSTAAGNQSVYNAFAASLNTFKTDHKIDGVDLDWEPLTPTYNQINNYGTLIQTLQAQTAMSISAAVNPELLPISGVPTGTPASRYVLTPTAVANIDQIGIMAYDFDTAQHALWQRSVDSLTGWKDYLAGVTVNDYATGQHVSKEKLLFGLPFYGRAGNAWSVDGEPYHDIVNKWISDQPTPTVAPVDGDSLWAGIGGYPGGAQWYFNGPGTINSKTGRALDEQVGGVMIWDLTDDHYSAAKDYDQYSLLPGIRTTTNARGTLTATAAYNPNALKSVAVTFAASVDAASIGPADLDLTNLTTGAKLDTAALATVSYNTTTKIATWTFANRLPDGNYTATIRAGAVRDASGNALKTDTNLSFFTLGGDANHDRTVNFDDLVPLSQNYNKTGQTYAQGDFTGDGIVNFDDLVILSQNYNKKIDAPPTLVAPIFSKTPIATKTRIATSVLA